MKELFIAGIVAWLIYQATKPDAPPAATSPVTMNIGPTLEDETPRQYPYPAEF